MKNNLRIKFLLVAFGIILGSTTINFAQVEPVMAGGYQTVETTDQNALAAAKFAVKEQAKKQKAKITIVSVNEAERQIVAGTNYRLCLKIEVSEKKKNTISQIVEAIVFQNLKQKLSLTSWQEKSCSTDVPDRPTN